MAIFGAELPELLTGLAALVTAIGGILAVIAKRESNAVRTATQALTAAIDRQQKDNEALRKQLAVSREQEEKYRSILREKGLL